MLETDWDGGRLFAFRKDFTLVRFGAHACEWEPPCRFTGTDGRAGDDAASVTSLEYPDAFVAMGSGYRMNTGAAHCLTIELAGSDSEDAALTHVLWCRRARTVMVRGFDGLTLQSVVYISTVHFGSGGHALALLERLQGD